MSHYDYPPDEFDQPVDAGQSVGIHRTGRSTWNKVWPFLLVIVVFGLLAYGVVALIASQSDKDETPPPAATSSAEPEESSAPEETEPEETTSEEPSEEPTEEPEEPSEEPTEEPTEEVAELDRGIAIRVLNATRQSGLAATGVTKLTNDGWTSTVAANYTGNPIQATAVWYKTEDNAAEAEQVAKDLGVGDAVLVPTLRGSISVILAGDFTG